jgi:hypothetical protein
MLLEDNYYINDKNIKVDNDSFNEFNQKFNIKNAEIKKDENDVFDSNNNSKIKYIDLQSHFMENYMSNSTNNSNIIDVIGIYIKGQKILYTEAKTVCEQRFTYLMLPSILFTIISGIINLFMDNLNGKIITTGLNGATTFILATINFLKLDARAEAHRSSAYKYDKLLSFIEFQSYKQLFLDAEKGKMSDIILKIENDVKDIKETNQFVLPETIRYNFPLLSNVNIFSEVKKIQSKEIVLMNKLVDILNSIKNIQQTIHAKNEDDNLKQDKKTDLELKIMEKEYLTNTIITVQNEYISLDKDFKEEIEKYRNKNKSWFLFGWLKV